MRVSIIIPTYNRCDFLYVTLLYIQKQMYSDIEVIIVDDGSTDNTHGIVELFKKMITIKYIYLPRTTNSSISRARNCGIKKSAGDILLILDCGVLLPDDFLETVVREYGKNENTVLIPVVYGMFAENDGIITMLKTMPPQMLQEYVLPLKKLQEWNDPRSDLYDVVNGELDNLPLPWSVAWGVAIIAHCSIFKRFGGYDEDLLGWGSEDTDFSYKLYLNGVSFKILKNSFIFHIPHPRSPSSLREKSNFKNRKIMHSKYYTLDTELYPYFPGLYYNQVIGRFNDLVVSRTIPAYSKEFIDTLRNQFLVECETSLLIGTDSIITSELFNTTHIFTHNKTTHSKFTNIFHSKSVQYLLGCHTNYSNDFFDVVIITDFFRLLPTNILNLFVKEIFSISKKVVFIFSEDDQIPTKNFSFFPWVPDLSVLRSIVEGLNDACNQKEKLYVVNYGAPSQDTNLPT
jgi:glycosyltransferase involved in cell wall biosynthesis